MVEALNCHHGKKISERKAERHLEDESQPLEHDKRAQRNVSSSMVLASVADVWSHIGHPQ